MYPVIGMSPGNSYFKQEVINQLLKQALIEYEQVGILIPDVPAVSTYIALGYPENRARRDKAIPQGNALRNKIKRAIEAEGFDASKVRIFDWAGEGIGEHGEYRKQFEYVSTLYKTNQSFKADADAATAQVLEENPYRKVPVDILAIELGVHYLLSELAFMLFLPAYVETSQVGYIYHRPWPVYERLIAGEYDDLVRGNIAFIRYPIFE